MKKLKTKWFTKWAKKQRLSDRKLLKAIKDMQNNLSCADLGGGLYKVRVSSEQQGKSSGSRIIIVYKREDRVVIVYGFMKNEQKNLTVQELKSFKTLAKDILSLSQSDLAHAIEQNVFMEIGGNQ